MKINQSIINKLFWITWILCVILTVVMFNLAMKSINPVYGNQLDLTNSRNLTPIQVDAMQLAADTMTKVNQALKIKNYGLACDLQTETVELLVTAEQYTSAYQAMVLQDKICGIILKPTI